MLKLIFEYIKVYLKEFSRDHLAAFFTLLFPAILLQCFGDFNIKDNSAKIATYIVYCNYAVQTVMLQSLGITISSTKGTQWNEYLRTLPVSKFPIIIGRICSNLIFASTSLALVMFVCWLHHGINLSMTQHSIIIICSLIGGIQMVFIAIFLGNLLSPAAARSVFVLLNILLLLGASMISAGGLMALLQQGIPSYQWLMFSISILFNQPFIGHGLWLLGYVLIFASLIMLKKN